MSHTRTPEDALEEYFSLKSRYEDKIKGVKENILLHADWSKQEKRKKFKEFKPACIHCNRPGGTIFQTASSGEKSRLYVAKCGILSNPCNLDIRIQFGNYVAVQDYLTVFQQEIDMYKENIIQNKNKLLFGILTSDQVFAQFEDLKEKISLASSLYEDMYEDYILKIENPEKKKERVREMSNYYILVDEIKQCIQKFNETKEKSLVVDAVNIYVTSIQPLVDKLRALKYARSTVDLVETNKGMMYHLVQSVHTLEESEINKSTNQVVAFNVAPFTK
jgi:hypothetical protein